MRCSKCNRQWKLSGADGPIGNAAPGHFLIIIMILTTIALVLGVQFRSIGGIAIGIIAAFLLLMCLVGCGYKDKQDRYQGSECPDCGHKNRIMPWDF